MGLDSEYFVIGDTAHMPLQVEIAPMTIKGKITGLMLLAPCMHPPFYLAEGQILAQAIPVPAEITADGKSLEVYWVEVVGEDRPSMVCNIAYGSERLHVDGVLDTATDVTVIPKTVWPSHWELQPVAGKLQGIGGITLAKISKNEDKVQRMPPWKYLGLEIMARTVVPQKLEIECNLKTLADLHSLCRSLNWDLTVHDMGLDSEYFVIGDTAHMPLQVEIAPMTIKGKITGLMLLAPCMHPPFYLAEGQILAQAIPVPAEITADGKSLEVYWVEVVGEDRPSMVCNIAYGSERLHVDGVLDTATDVTVIPKTVWPSHWELQPVAGKLQGIGGITLAKISKNVVQIEGPEGKLASVHPFLAEYKAPLWGRDTMSQWGVQLVVPKTPQDF
ncbi:hypothetical protein HGM15179_020922 [Zosterops borbonicus]|uniref:Peptidase A2 domain-containing protein n=1 Tax=Zosterops borbonicus TaxID=364589 RepID=A0A8K1D6Q7_9PASS|nr:hypothetical protein HGM15179_020922 [Zosterops borbonicus]